MGAPATIDASSVDADVEEYLHRHEQKEILRFVAVGSVDDGKSTLIGRLLHDTDGVYEDQLRAVERASQTGRASGRAGGDEIDFSLFTDGLKAEREQGITIDVAYRYFATARRKFIIADTPGHVQYTRNMATGASTAQVAIILIDARLGVLTQSRRHAYIASLLGIPDLVVGVNKMDLRDWDEGVFAQIREDFGAIAGQLGFRAVHFVPVSALKGDNVVHPSAAMPWYTGPTVLGLLETIPIARDQSNDAFRFPVQTVLRPHLDYRGFAGQIASGIVRKGDTIMALPSRKTSHVAGIDTFAGELDEAFAPMSVSLRLADEIDISRGDVLTHPGRPPRVVQRFDAMLVWMHERPLDRQKSYFIKHTSTWGRAEVEAISHLVDLETLEPRPAEHLGLNDIAQVKIHSYRPLFVDAYAQNRATGAFILVDSLTNDTVAAGMVLAPAPGSGAEALVASEPFAAVAHTQVSATERRERLGHAGSVVTIEGTSPEKALSVAYATERLLFDRGVVATVVPGGTPEIAQACADAGLVALWVRTGAQAEPGSASEPESDVERAAAEIVRAWETGGVGGGG